MSFNIKPGASWQTLISGWVKPAGTWEQLKSVWIKVSGVWQLVFSGVTLSGHTNTASRAGADCTADFKFDNDGNVYERDNGGSYSQIDVATDWIRPTSAAPGDYYVRYTNAVGDIADLTATVAENVWHAFATSDFLISILDSTPVIGGKSATFDIEIKNGVSGPTLASASYTLTADREDA